MKKSLILCLIVGVIFLSSCQKEVIVINEPTPAPVPAPTYCDYWGVGVAMLLDKPSGGYQTTHLNLDGSMVDGRYVTTHFGIVENWDAFYLLDEFQESQYPILVEYYIDGDGELSVFRPL